MSRHHPATRRRAGQALLESCFVITLLALVLFGLLEIIRLQASRAVLEHAASAGARAEAVGFNSFMVRKVVRVATIPNAGAMITPGYERPAGSGARWGTDRAGTLWDFALRAQPGSPQLEVERSRIPLYLSADHGGQLPAILDYTDWDAIQHNAANTLGAVVRMTVRQPVPMRFPFSRAFYAEDVVRQSGDVELDNHHPAYLE